MNSKTEAKPTRRLWSLAATKGAIGSGKKNGQISRAESSLSWAARRISTSRRLPVQKGLTARAWDRRWRKCRNSNVVSTVLPTPVSVPEMKMIRLLGNRAIVRSTGLFPGETKHLDIARIVSAKNSNELAFVPGDLRVNLDFKSPAPDVDEWT